MLRNILKPLDKNHRIFPLRGQVRNVLRIYLIEGGRMKKTGETLGETRDEGPERQDSGKSKKEQSDNSPSYAIWIRLARNIPLEL